MAALNQKEWRPLGKVGKAHGLKGAFYLTSHDRSLSPKHEEIAVGETLAQALVTRLRTSREHCHKNLVELEAIKDRTQADQLRDMTIWGKTSVMEHPTSWLIGKQVLDSQGIELGSVESIYNYGASDILEITSSEHGSLQIPFIPHYFAETLDSSLPTVSLLVTQDFFSELWAEK